MLPFWRKRNDEPLPAAPSLLPLTPKYDVKNHGMYFGAIETALTGPGSESVKNLALSGGYGVGKSSILGEVARRHKDTVITISLSTLGFSDKPTETEGVAKTASTRTNRIQKEIVKQLLYSQDPVKMPGSRYKRVTRFRLEREVGFAALIAIPMTLVFFLSGWSGALGSLARIPADGVDWVNVPIFIAALAFVVGVRKVMHNRVHIERISTGGATIALSAQSATFFDEYLDEIVYFFERTKINLIIFEDIDRFDDPHIFEALRALNSLLNGAKQLDGRVIRFVYAIKDSIFDELGQRAAQEELDGAGDDGGNLRANKARKDEAEVELARANRTKFFDQVIPVVPFVTHLSARNLLKLSLDGEVEKEGGKAEGGIDHKVTNEFIDLVGRYLADMRLIKNVRNEFAIFRQRIIVEGSLDLSDDGVLAMILYKSTHLSDFERIKHRKSDLDKLYEDYRALVNNNVARLSAQIRADRNTRNNLKAASVWSQSLGDGLIAFLDDHVQSQGASMQMRGFSGEALDDGALRSPAVWRRIAAGEQVVVTYIRQVGYSNFNFSSKFTKEQLSRALRASISPDDWVKAERARLDKRIASETESIAFLRTASMKQLLARDEFVLTEGGNDNFSAILERRLGSELARQLVRQGYIDQNFTLYTSTFHDVRVSAEATNFMMKNVDTHTADMVFALTDSDVESILREKGRSVLSDNSAYNISFLDYLLRNDAAGVEVMVDRLARAGEAERALLLEYLANGDESDALVANLTPTWSGILPFLVSEAGLVEARRDELIDLALRSLSDNVEYESDEAVGQLLLERHAAMGAFTSSDISNDAARRIGVYVDALEIELPRLALLSTSVRSAVAAVGGYIVDRENLLLALGGEEPSIALDAMKVVNKRVYSRALADLEAYLSALTDDEVSMANEDAFVEIIGDILNADSDHLSDVVQRAARTLEVDDLQTVSEDAWAVLARDKRFPATFANVTAYIEQYGLDEALAGLLIEAEYISVDEETPEAEKLDLALTIVGAKKLIADPAVRSHIAKSLDLSYPIEASSVPVEQGELIGRLIGDGVIADDASAFARLVSDDWSGLEYAISRSTDFVDFMTPTELPVAYVGRLMVSNVVDGNVKSAVLDRLTEFRAKISRQAFDQTVTYALKSGHGLGLSELIPIASWMSESEALALLQPHLSSISEEALVAFLQSLKGNFEKIAGPTGKRPKFKSSPALLALLARLKELGWMRRSESDGDDVRAHMYSPPK